MYRDKLWNFWYWSENTRRERDIKYPRGLNGNVILQKVQYFAENTVRSNKFIKI